MREGGGFVPFKRMPGLLAAFILLDVRPCKNKNVNILKTAVSSVPKFINAYVKKLDYLPFLTKITSRSIRNIL